MNPLHNHKKINVVYTSKSLSNTDPAAYAVPMEDGTMKAVNLLTIPELRKYLAATIYLVYQHEQAKNIILGSVQYLHDIDPFAPRA